MTKRIRVENADTTDHKVEVEVWEDGTGGPTFSHKINLHQPTEMADVYIHSTRFLIIREVANVA